MRIAPPRWGLAPLGAAAALGALTWSEPALARRESGPSAGGIFVNPVGLFHGPLALEFGFGLGPTASLNFSAAQWSRLPADESLSAFSAGVGAQIFASGPIYDGVYAYPSLHVLWIAAPAAEAEGEPQAAEAETPTEPARVTAFAPQILFGYQWDWKVVSLRLGIGGVYLAQGQAQGEADLGVDGIALALDLGFGVTF